MVPGTNPVCPWDKPSLSLGQALVVPGTNQGFLLILHSGSPRAKPSLSLGQRAAEHFNVLKVYVPFSLAMLGPPGNEVRSQVQIPVSLKGRRVHQAIS